MSLSRLLIGSLELGYRSSTAETRKRFKADDYLSAVGL